MHAAVEAGIEMYCSGMADVTGNSCPSVGSSDGGPMAPSAGQQRQQQQLQQQQQLCGDLVHLAWYMLTRGLLLMAVQPAVALITSIMSGSYSDQPRDDATDDASMASFARHNSGNVTPGGRTRRSLLSSQQLGPDTWPLESFGLAPFLSGPVLGPALRAAGEAMERLARGVSAVWVVRLLCLPCGGFYLLRALLARVDEKVGRGGTGGSCHQQVWSSCG